MSNFATNLQGVCGYKTVQYFEHTLKVPDNVSWLATDEDGDLYGYCGDIPEAYRSTWSNNSCQYTYLGKIQYTGDWEQSLEEV